MCRLLCSVHEAEEKLLGLSHCDGGRILADKWHLAACIVDTIKYHHRFSQLSDYLPLVALVNISDRLCRIHGLGYGFRESIRINWLQDEAIEIVSQAWPIAKTVQLAVAERRARFLPQRCPEAGVRALSLQPGIRLRD